MALTCCNVILRVLMVTVRQAGPIPFRGKKAAA
jgi:hypothetical protein